MNKSFSEQAELARIKMASWPQWKRDFLPTQYSAETRKKMQSADNKQGPERNEEEMKKG